MSTFAERLDDVRGRMAAACARAGRPPGDVTLVAVAKFFGPEAVAEAAAAGVDTIGENRVQEAAAKIPLCPSRLSWHMVGHLQRNKARTAAALFDRVHGVDSIRLLEALDAACDDAGKRIPVCLEINVSGEGSKFGLRPEDAPVALDRANGLANVRVTGLMTIPPYTPEPEDARRHFRRLRTLRDEWERSLGTRLPDLSMGMSGDFEVAIEEGATMIRVGTALFGPRPKATRPVGESGDDA
jgi:pyridoxal phosphate enzyme (YggS family)